MIKMHKAILFDLDGTLIDSKKDLIIAVNNTMEEFGYAPLEQKLILRYVGNGIRQLLADCSRKEDILKDMVKWFISFYRKHLIDNTKPYPDIIKVLTILKEKGVKMAVVTNKMTELSNIILNDLNMSKFFDTVSGGDLFLKKPNPELIIKTADKLNSKSYVIIGDSENDIIAGKIAEFQTAAALWGLRPPALLKSLSPDYMLPKAENILEVI